MENFLLVENFERPGHFYEDAPYLLLVDELVRLLLLEDLLVEVAVVGKLHHEAERGRRILEERLLVSNDRIGLKRGQDPNFV